VVTIDYFPTRKTHHPIKRANSINPTIKKTTGGIVATGYSPPLMTRRPVRYSTITSKKPETATGRLNGLSDTN